jgi:hypothetical protein
MQEKPQAGCSPHHLGPLARTWARRSRSSSLRGAQGAVALLNKPPMRMGSPQQGTGWARGQRGGRRTAQRRRAEECAAGQQTGGGPRDKVQRAGSRARRLGFGRAWDGGCWGRLAVLRPTVEWSAGGAGGAGGCAGAGNSFAAPRALFPTLRRSIGPELQRAAISPINQPATARPARATDGRARRESAVARRQLPASTRPWDQTPTSLTGPERVVHSRSPQRREGDLFPRRR